MSDKQQQEHPKFGLFVGVGFDGNGREGIGRSYTMFDLYSGVLYFNKSGKILSAVSDDGKRPLSHAEMIARPDFGEFKQVTMTIGQLMPLPIYDDAKMNIVYTGGKFARADSVYPSKVREMIDGGKTAKEIYDWLFEKGAILGQEKHGQKYADLKAEQEARELRNAQEQQRIAHYFAGTEYDPNETGLDEDETEEKTDDAPPSVTLTVSKQETPKAGG